MHPHSVRIIPRAGDAQHDGVLKVSNSVASQQRCLVEHAWALVHGPTGLNFGLAVDAGL